MFRLADCSASGRHRDDLRDRVVKRLGRLGPHGAAPVDRDRMTSESNVPPSLATDAATDRAQSQSPATHAWTAASVPIGSKRSAHTLAWTLQPTMNVEALTVTHTPTVQGEVQQLRAWV